MQTKNNYERKNIWFDKEKFKECQDKLTQQNWFYTATPVETLTHCTSEWIKTDNDLKNFCFYFSDILKTHLYDKKENRWLENPFDDNNFCEAMFNLLNENKTNLSRNCVLLLKNFCLPDIHTNHQNMDLFYSIAINAMDLFFANKWTHIPKPSNNFIDFLRKQIFLHDIEDYCTEFINSKLKSGLEPKKLSSRKWILVQENDEAIQTQNNFVISYLLLFLDKKFKYPFECEKNGLDFIESAMNIYENMYKTFMQWAHSKTEDAIYDFFNMFSIRFIKHIIYSYREDKTASIKFKHGIYLFHRFCSILRDDEKLLNSVLENLFKIIDVEEDFVLPYKNAYGKWNFIKLCGDVGKNYIANKLSSEKSVSDLMNGQILNYEELLPDELIDKMKKYNDKSKSELQFDIKQEIFLIKNGIFYCDENKFLENIESICKIFGLISNKDGEAKRIDDIHLKDFFKLLADNKFNLFKYVCKLESCYGGVAIRGISFLISEFEKFINYHSVKNEANKLFLSNSNDNTFTKKHLFPNPYVCSLYNLMITKFIKAQTESDDLADIVSILLKKFGSIYNLINQVKDILAEKDYGYKLKGLWNFVLDCVLYVDKKSDKSVLSILIKCVHDSLKKYVGQDVLEEGEVALYFVRTAMLLIDAAKAFDYDTNIFCEGTKSENDTSNKTFDLLNKILGDENFKSFFELDKTLSIDLESIKMCFQQMKNLNFEVLFYLTDEIFNPNVKQLEQFSPLLEKCKDLCSQNNKITVFDIIRKTETLVQKKVSKMERLNKIKNEAKKIKNYANEIKVNNLENKNLFLDQIQTETEKEISKANDLVNKLLKQAKKVVGSIDIGERGSYLLHSDLLNEYFNSLYEIFCMVYDPKQHSNLNSKYKNTYIEIISDSYNSTMVTKISEYTISAITSLNKKNIFEKIDEMENVDTEIIGNIIWLIKVNLNDQVVFFKNKNGENIIFSVIDGLRQLQTNIIDYKKKLGLFNTDQLLNELKNYKYQEISFGDKLIKKAERKQERLLNNLDIKSGQFDAELYKKKKKAMTQLTDLNIYTIKLIASLCTLKSIDNYKLPIDTVNSFCKKLHDFLNMLYVLEDGKNRNSEYKNACKEVIDQQQKMVIEISKFTIDAIKFLNEKDVFEKVYLPNYKNGEEIDIKIIDDIILLLSNISKEDVIFFKDEKGKNITSDVIDELKLLKTNLKINGLRQKFQDCKERYPQYIYSFISNANECFKDLRDFLSILKTESKEQAIYQDVLSNKQNSQMFMLAETSNIILEVIKILNSKEFDGKKLKDIKDIDDQIIGSIIALLSNDEQKTDIVFFKDEKGQNITSDIIDGLKLLKTNLKINGLRLKFQECKEDYTGGYYSFVRKANICFKDLHDFLSILKTESKEQAIYQEVLCNKQNSQMFMLAETSNIILEVIKILNSKEFDGEYLKDIDDQIIGYIIDLLSNDEQKTDIVFFKDEKGQNITSDVIDELKLLKTNLKTNLKINGLRQKFQKCKEYYPQYIYSFVSNANICFKDLHDFLSILKTESKEQAIYQEVLCNKQNSQMFMLVETSNIILDVIKILNSKEFDGRYLKDIDDQIIGYIIDLLSNDEQKTDIVFFKDEKGANITSDITNGLKLLKTNIESYIYDKESKKAIELLTELKYSSLIIRKVSAEEINKCFDNLYKVLCMIYVPEKIDDLKSKYKELYRKTISDSANLELAITISERLEELINNLNNQISEYVKNPEEIKIETIESIIKLFSVHRDDNVIIFKNQQEANITSDIFDKMKKLKENLSQYINDKNKLQTSNTNQNIDKNKIIDTDTNQTNASDDREEFLNEENDDKNTIQDKNDTSKNDYKQNIKNNIDESTDKFMTIKNLFGNNQNKQDLIDKRSKSLYISRNKIEILLNEMNKQEANDCIKNKVDKNNNEDENEYKNLLCTKNNLNTKNKSEDTNDDEFRDKSYAIEKNQNEIENENLEEKTLSSADKFKQSHSDNDINGSEINKQIEMNSNYDENNLEAKILSKSETNKYGQSKNVELEYKYQDANEKNSKTDNKNQDEINFSEKEINKIENKDYYVENNVKLDINNLKTCEEKNVFQDLQKQAVVVKKKKPKKVMFSDLDNQEKNSSQIENKGKDKNEIKDINENNNDFKTAINLRENDKNIINSEDNKEENKEKEKRENNNNIITNIVGKDINSKNIQEKEEEIKEKEYKNDKKEKDDDNKLNFIKKQFEENENKDKNIKKKKRKERKLSFTSSIKKTEKKIDENSKDNEKDEEEDNIINNKIQEKEEDGKKLQHVNENCNSIETNNQAINLNHQNQENKKEGISDAKHLIENKDNNKKKTIVNTNKNITDNNQYRTRAYSLTLKRKDKEILFNPEDEVIPTTKPSNKKKIIFAIIFGIIFVLSAVLLTLALTIEALNVLALVISMAVVAPVMLIITIVLAFLIYRDKKISEPSDTSKYIQTQEKCLDIENYRDGNNKYEPITRCKSLDDLNVKEKS